MLSPFPECIIWKGFFKNFSVYLLFKLSFMDFKILTDICKNSFAVNYGNWIIHSLLIYRPNPVPQIFSVQYYSLILMLMEPWTSACHAALIQLVERLS